METYALQDKSNPNWPSYSHHLFLCYLQLLPSLCVSLSVSLRCSSLLNSTVSLLPLSLVSLSRNRTKGGRRSSSLGFKLRIWYEICPLQAGGALSVHICTVKKYHCEIHSNLLFYTQFNIVNIFYSRVLYLLLTWPILGCHRYISISMYFTNMGRY